MAWNLHSFLQNAILKVQYAYLIMHYAWVEIVSLPAVHPNSHRARRIGRLTSQSRHPGGSSAVKPKTSWKKVAVRTAIAFAIGVTLLLHWQLVWSDDPKPAVPPPPKADAKASLKLDLPDTMEAVTGETTPFAVKVVREGYDGPVTVKLDGLPGATKTAEVTILAGKDDASYDL